MSPNPKRPVMTREWSIEDKKVFAEIMRWTVVDNDVSVVYKCKDGTCWHKLGHIIVLDHFKEILEGLSNSEKFAILFEGTIPEESQRDPFDVYLWIENHKTEVLEAILTVMEGE